MGCINRDGALTFTAKDVLEALGEPRTPEEIRDIARQPLYRVRASLREMEAAGYVSTEDGRWRITESGRAALERPIG
jgi:predicted transcriptional regulator